VRALDTALDPHLLLGAVRDGSGVIVDFEVADVNIVACSYMRMRPQELQGTRILDRLPATHGAALVALLADVVGSGSRLDLQDSPHPHEREVSERRYDVRGIRAGDGVAVTWRDVTARHASEAKALATDRVAATEEQYRLALDGAAIGTCLVATDGRFLRVNTALCETLGRDRSDLLASTWQQLTHPDDLDADLALVDDVLEGRRRSYRRLKRFIAADGRVIWGNQSVAAIRNADGTVRNFVSQIVDVTERVAAERSLAEREEMFRVVLDHTSDAIMRFGPDLRVVYVNKRLIDFTGITFQDWLGKTFHEAGFPPHLTEPWDEYSRQVFATGEPVLHEFELDLPAGHRWFETRVDPEFAPDGSVSHVITTSRDVTARIVAEQTRRESTELVRVVLDNSRDATTRYDRDLRVGYVNRRVTELSGKPADAWVGRTMSELGYPAADVVLWTAHLRAVIETGEPGTFEYEVDNADGHTWYEASVAPQFAPDGSVTHVVSTNRDVTARKAAQAELQHLATRDSLTGLANRAALLDDIGRSLSAGLRTGRATAVLMIDLDRFKYVNDSLGHGVGDGLLQAAGHRIQTQIRGADLVGRLGGDEFLVVMRDLEDPAEAIRAAQRIVADFRGPFATRDGELYATASIGVTIATEASRPDDLVREADTAMYVAKAEGRDRVSLFNEDLRAAVTTRLQIEGELRHALERGELAVWYQPEIDLASGSVIAVEALLRWHHPDGQVRTADQFIHVAEETGLILNIGDWVLQEACTQAATWATTGQGRALTVRVNLSALQLTEAGLLDAIDGALASSGLDPARLCVEITETALLRDTTTARDNLTGISNRGIDIAIDDFGTGYASLTYLRQYPIDVLKIDRSFITHITTNDHDRRLVAGIIALARQLDVSVTAEGVEHEDQATALRALGCPGAQGWLYSKAVPPEQITTLLDTTYPN
jgi:diguanylate cyclase (GGDEF)-like protein/PAS domain S-box-containing protein